MDTLTIHVLYRFYSATDELLYIGRTENPPGRLGDHRREKTWWDEVARIGIERHPELDLAGIKAAETAAIELEKPKYNVQHNGHKIIRRLQPTPGVTVDTTIEVSGLVGRFFHSWRDLVDDEDTSYATVRNGRVLVWQGRIVSQIDDEHYLIELYSWLDGAPTGTHMARLDDMYDWTFYVNHIDMNSANGCAEASDGQRCGAPAEYFADTGLGGGIAVCYRCASYYGGARPIVWRNNIPELGAPIQVEREWR